MALVLKTNRKPHWIKILESRDKPEGKKNPVLASFKVIPLQPNEVREIFKKCETVKWEVPPSVGKREFEPRKEVTVDDPFEFVIMKAKKTIIGWEGILTEDKNGDKIEIPYSEEMVETLYGFNPDVINYVLEEADKLSNLWSKSEDGELKN